MIRALESNIRKFFWGTDKGFFRILGRFLLIRLLRPFLRVRYMPVVRYLLGSTIKNPTVLELGSSSVGITLFYAHPVTGLDVNFEGPQLGRLKMIQGDCRELSFADASFDYVISLDMLEHLNALDRERVVAEMIRVSRRGMVLGFPAGLAARQAEEKLAAFLRQEHKRIGPDQKAAKRLSERYWFLDEHLSQPLPDVDEVCGMLHRELARQKITARITIQPNERLDLWYTVMSAYVRPSFLYFALSFLMNVVPYSWLSHRELNQCYRAIIFLEKQA